jgi:hypothetical protein
MNMARSEITRSRLHSNFNTAWPAEEIIVFRDWMNFIKYNSGK